MPDPYQSFTAGLESPAQFAAAVTPNDSVDLGTSCRALYIGGAGNVTLTPVGGGANVTFVGLAAGSVLSVRASRVLATGTTATSIVALW